MDEKKLWASRFKKDPDPLALHYSDSITVDRPLFYHDIWGSQAHSIMLGYTGIVAKEHVKNILKSLKKVKTLFTNKAWDLQLKDEDVHMNVERFIIDDVGIESGGRMHTTRSRNDQVVLDTKLYAREQLLFVQNALSELIQTLLHLAPEHVNTIMPGYTHTQHAQPMTYAYWLTYYASVFLRDLERLTHAYKTTNINPLGGGALTGTSFPINRELTTYLMGFDKPQIHCLDATTSRDFTLEILSSLATLCSTISRLAEEIILGITYEFRLFVLDDSFSMGSSMMPQKKNPGVLELVRARTGKINGILVAMLTMLKGLPSGYNRDYHEDKENLVSALPLVRDTLKIMTGVIKTLRINKQRMEELTEKNFASATELANFLVREHNIPFRLCHRVVGYVVGELVNEGKNFTDYQRTQELLKDKEIRVSIDKLQKLLKPSEVINSYTSLGGTSPTEVRRIIEDLNQSWTSYHAQLKQWETQLNKRLEETNQIADRIIEGTSIAEAVEAVVQNLRIHKAVEILKA